VSDGKDAELGHCFVDYVDRDGSEIALGPRAQLKNAVDRLSEQGLHALVSFELEFFLFKESFEEARTKKYRDLTPIGVASAPMGYLNRSAFYSRPFMEEVTQSLNWKGIEWEGWSDQAAPGQLVLNLKPVDPVKAADNAIRIKEIIYEVAVEMGMSATFMAKPLPGYGNGMHIHHSLLKEGKPVLYDENCTNSQSELFNRWMGGLIKTMPAAVSLLYPNVNSFRRMADSATVPTAVCWGEDNRSAALRSIMMTSAGARIECRIGSADANPYLALTALIAGGIAGMQHQLDPEYHYAGHAEGIPDDYPRLPTNITKAAEALQDDPLLAAIMGSEFVQYWIKSRQWEWQMYHSVGGDTTSNAITDWELSRYFELV
jgi:glutamine synthetase